MKYRKKPIVIEAFQFKGSSNLSPGVPLWFVQAVLDGIIRALPDGLEVLTLEGAMRADLGDWIIKGVKGEIYPCKSDVFAASYDEERECFEASPVAFR